MNSEYKEVLDLFKNNFDNVLEKKTEIGFFRERFDSEFLGLKGEVEVYHLHNNYIVFDEGCRLPVAGCRKMWEVFSCGEGGIVQAVKLKGKEFYGVLFHPEVRNKNMILEFISKPPR